MFILKEIFTYYPLILTIISTILNSLILIIFSQDKFRQRPTIYYIRFIALVDILMMYGWNLDNFFRLKYNFELERLTILTCKLFSFYNHVVNQSSAWLRVLMCADRFYTLNRIAHRRIANRHRCILFSILLTLILISLLNLHLPIFACYHSNNQTNKIELDSIYYSIYPMWYYVDLIFYNLLPFCLMLIYNLRIIRHLIILKRTSTFSQSRIQHRSISISIFISTFLFGLMTTPGTILFAFFGQELRREVFENVLLSLFDSIQSTYHSISFFIYLFTLVDFRNEFIRLIQCSYSIHEPSIHTISTLHRYTNRNQF